MARLVVPGYPHHVTQRGNRRQQTFYCDDDYHEYLRLLRKYQLQTNVQIWAYCLMPNHVHLVAVPSVRAGLSRIFGLTHQRYARIINSRFEWQGHLWQERFHSFVMDEDYLLATVRYVELNPVRAGLVERPEQWRWSSVHTHLVGATDPVVDSRVMSELVADWRTYLSDDQNDLPSIDSLRRHTASGRPAGRTEFIQSLEAQTGRRLRKRKPGPKSTRSIR